MDLGSRDEIRLTVGHHFFAWLQPLRNHILTIDCATDSDRTGFHRTVRLEHKDVLAILPSLDGLGWNDNRVGFRRQGEDDVNELPRPELLLEVGKVSSS